MGIQLSKTRGGYLSLENPKKQLMKMLIDKTRDVGHLLSFREACEDPNMIDPNNYAFYFGSFREAAELAWRKVSESKLDQCEAEDNLDEADDNYFLDDIPKRSESGSRKKDPRNQKYTREQVKGKLIAFYRRNGRMPTKVDVESDPDMPSWATLHKHFGYKSEWVKLIPQELRDRSSPLRVIQVTPGQVSEDGVKIITSHHWQGNDLFVEIKINRPDRINPILITLTV